MIEIYLITNLKTGKKYVGKTSTGYQLRWWNHKSAARQNVESYLYRSIRKHGEDNFDIEALETVNTEEQASEREKYWIKQLNTTDRSLGYNLKDGGEGSELPEETKQKIGKAAKQRYIDRPELREVVGNINRGRPMSEETKLKISESKKGKKPNRDYEVSEEQRKKISETLKKYYENNPNRKTEISESLKTYYEEHPERKEIIRSQVKLLDVNRERDEFGRFIKEESCLTK